MAGGARQGDDETPITDINVTPLVDVVLVLLIILMVTATAIVRHKEIPVELPDAPTADSPQKEQPTTLAVSVDQAGQIYLDAEKIDLEGLKAKARESREKDPETRAILNADARIPHGQVVSVIDALRQANVIKFAINVRPSDLEEPTK
jgi:biopolymer transport protein ExbD